MLAAAKAAAYFADAAGKGEQKMTDVFSKAGVKIVKMTPDDYQAWMTIAKNSSYKKFAEKVKGGDKLLEKALAVK
ncbi:hypothetical protein CDEF62S_00348 [Castellaniella defragrans]